MNTQQRTLAVGEQFDTMEELRRLCEKVAVTENFTFTTKQADKTRYTIKCSISETCPWRLYAAVITTEGHSRLVKIKTLNNTHTCFGVRTNRHKNASSSFISSVIQARLHDQPKYRPTDIVDDIRREQGVHIGYWTAFRGKEKALAAINGSHESAYSQLPKYCEDILHTNPGSTVLLDRTPEDRFQRMFLSYAALGIGFAYCRPVLGLDGTHLKARYNGVLLAATSVDANGRLFPLAYAVVDAENNDNWAWFVESLRTVIQQHAQAYLVPGKLTFVSDRQKGLLEAVDQVFPDSPHGYCLRHLHENFHKQFPNKLLKELLYKAARAISEEVFNDIIQQMHDVNPASVKWLLKHADPKHWVEFYFPGHRYGHITSNIAESLNAWLSEAREKPIMAMFEQIRHQLMEWFSERRQLDLNTEGILVSRVAKDIQTLISTYSRRYRILAANDDVYEIFSPETARNYIVQVIGRTCTCCSWQTSGIPCVHALAVSLNRGDDPQTYAHSFFQLNAYRGIYGNTIFPPNTDVADTIATYMIPSDHESNNTDSDEGLLPPHTRRAPGRPKKRRIRSGTEGGDRGKRVFRCGRCGKEGHSRRTCAEPI
jgi:hypothetical protein